MSSEDVSMSAEGEDEISQDLGRSPSHVDQTVALIIG